MTLIVEAINLKKTYLLGKVPVVALNGVNLKVKEGDFLLDFRAIWKRKINDVKFNWCFG